MENDHLNDMYGSDDIDLVRPIDGGVRMTQRGVLTEVKIGDQKMMVVDPVVVQRMESIIRSLQHKIAVLEQDLRIVQSRVSNTERGLNEAHNELRTKIGYE